MNNDLSVIDYNGLSLNLNLKRITMTLRSAIDTYQVVAIIFFMIK